MNEVHRNAVVVDCHNDLILMVERARRLGNPGTLAARWLPRLREGGVDVQVLPIHMDEAYLPESALRRTLLILEALHREAGAAPQETAVCRTGEEIDAAVAAGKVALVIALEGGQAIGRNPELIGTFFTLGVRMSSFTWFDRTFLADGSGEDGAGSRLTRAGVEALAEMERVGMVFDVSHLGRAGTEHALSIATRPVVASHSSARAIRDYHRNLDDELLKGVAATGGVVGINFFPGFIDLRIHTVDRIVDHIEHVAGVAGIDHVGLGPDFVKELYAETAPDELDIEWDGMRASDSIEGLEGPQDLPVLTDRLLERGFPAEDVAKILGANFLRVFRQVMGVPGFREARST